VPNKKWTYKGLIFQKNELSGQRIFVSVTWTPSEEGKIRELVTFVVNDVIKHQAVLLGAAEQPPKKKKSLWDTLKKKNSSGTSAIDIKKSTSENKNVNKTFRVSQKVERLRSPLQSCENQNTVQNSISQGNDPLAGTENLLPPSPIAPVLEERGNTVHTPLALRRSTTFGDIDASGNEELLSKIDICNINKCVTEHNQLQPESASSCAGLAQLPISNDGGVLNFTLSPFSTQEHSASAPVLSTRRILSPDAFVSGNYQVDIDVIEQPFPILSPDQFVKDSLSDKPSKTPKPEEALVSSTSETCVVKRFLPSKWSKDEGVETETHIHIENSLNEVFELHNVKSQAFDCDKRKEDHCSFPSAEELQTNSPPQRKQTKKRPILSVTVIKRKPGATEETRTETHQPKSKKCLNKAILGCVNVVHGHMEAETSKYLPVIAPISSEKKCHNDNVNSSTGSTLCRKRKSETYVGSSTVAVHVEEVERKRALTSSMDNKTHRARQPSACKSMSGETVGQRKKAGSSLQKASKPTKRITKSVPGLAQSQLTFVKPLKTVIPRHPMPFAAKNMFYDERWKEKQQRGFTWWLNFVLTPDDFNVKTNTSQVNATALILGEENHHKMSLPKAPTKDEASLKAYTARRKLNRLRREACRLFTSETMVKAIQKLEVEIESRRLLVRRDRHLWKDIGERQKVLNWLLSYNPLWLRIGLETIYGELIALESNSDVMGLAIFILNRLLWNPDIAAEYRHPVVPHLYREGHEEALSKFTLKKLLLLVCFLDCAKQSRMIDHDPCLFCKDAEFKASKDLLLAFSRDFLSGEGDLSRHLCFLGLPVSHIQTPLDEFDFAVTNLAVDLQCGIRLVRTVELLTKNWSLSKQLRVPAVSRLQKIHNVDIVLNVLKERGVHLKDETGASIDSRDIVDRHRERTLALLWKIVFAFQVDVFLNVEHLKEEIEFLKSTHKRKALLGAVKTFPNYFRVQEDSSNFSSQTYSENVKLLMAWVNAVCRFYNIKVENFTVCFSDGRVLCHLIHHYHPCYMPLEAVCQRTTQTVECSRTVTVGLNSSSSSESDTSLNFMLKSISLNYRLKRQLKLSQERDRAARIIQKFAMNFLARRHILRKENAAIFIQKHWRGYLTRRTLFNLEKAKLEEARNKSATVIQAAYRGYKARQWVSKMRAAQVIQAWFRGHKARKEYASVLRATLVIQSHFRAKQLRTRFLKMKSCALTIQRVWRATRTAQMLQQQFLKHQAACLIQNAYRGFKARRKFVQQKAAAVVIQKHLRAWREGRLQFMKYNKTRRAVTKLQAFIRGYLVRRKISDQKQKKRLLYFTAAAYHHISAIKIQRAYRIHLTLKLGQTQISSVLIIQRWFRAKMERKRFLRNYQRLLRLQRVVRSWLNHRNEAATIIQRNVRRFLACRRRRKFAVGIIKFQALWRGYSWRKMTDTAKTRALRHSLEKAKEKSREENKLGNRTAIAIDHLLKYKHLSYILAALKHLEVATRLSPLCCENMAQSRAIFSIFVLIRNCNRSVPCMDVIKYSVQVLLNVSKYERTTQAVYEAENSIDTLLDLLQMYRGKAGDKVSEKGGSIFTKTCCLLAILSKDSKRALVRPQCFGTVSCIQSLFKLTARKHRMDAERTLMKQKTSTALGGSCSVPVTPLRIKTVSRIKPDWVLRRDNMQEVVDPLQAIVMVMDTLGIACF
uniref:Assembly factor for spindle microtubules n=1 Tax=Cyanistes caeruleus TaxID=156563 RepID=A0A8C0VMC9_CYACU